ncbi:MAG: alpha/beta hydrolase fold protein [Conexibacter sp.]|nr:alpha/beta hydrolase fold protein [Conexibacter sp.]
MPHIVLIHGAWADASSWAAVISRLQQAGHTVDAPPNLLRGVAPDAAYVADYLRTLEGPIVLVGHSYGGAVITNAATGNEAVKALVYVDAFIPDEGETVLELASAQPGSALGDPPKTFNFVPYPGAPEGEVDLYIKQSMFHAVMAADQSEGDALIRAAGQRPLAASALEGKSGVPAWKSIPSWAVIGTEDRAIPPAEQVVMTERAKAKTTKVTAAHLSMISQPDVVTAVIVEAATDAGALPNAW